MCILETPPERVIRDCFPWQSRTRLARSGRYRSLAGILWSRRRSWDFAPFAVLLRFAGDGVFRRLAPTCRFAACPPRVSSSRSPPIKRRAVGFAAAASGVWPHEPAVPCDPPVPPWLLRTGPIGFTCRYCLGLLILSQVFAVGLRPPLLAPFRPWALCAAASTRLQAIRSRRSRRACPSAL